MRKDGGGGICAGHSDFFSSSFTHPSDENTRFQTTSSQKKKITRQRPHTIQEKHAAHTAITMSYRLLQVTHTHVHWVCWAWWQQGVSQKKLTSPANTVHPVWMWARRESSSENGRCSPPHHKHDLQSENRSSYSLNEVSVDQKQIWGVMTSHSRSSSCCASAIRT